MNHVNNRFPAKSKVVLVMILAMLAAVAVLGKETRAAENIPELMLNDGAVAVGNNEYFCFTPETDGAYEVRIKCSALQSSSFRIYSYHYNENTDGLYDKRDGGVDLGETDCDYDSTTNTYRYDKAIPYYLEAGHTYLFELYYMYMNDGEKADVSIQRSTRAGIKDGFFWHMCDNYAAKTDYAVLYDYKGDGRASITVPGTVGDNDAVPVKKIADATFHRETSITSIQIGENIEGMGANFPINCPNLERVELPSTMKNLSRAFHCSANKLHTITFPNGSEYFSIQADALIENRTGSLIYYFGSETGQYAVPDGVLYFEMDCFIDKEETPFQKLILPESLEAIHSMIYAKEVHFENSCVVIPGNNNISSDTVCYGNSHSLLEKWCQEKGISFVSTGEQQKEFTLSEEKPVKVETYEDGIAYCSFTPSDTSLYRLNTDWYGGMRLTILDASGKDVTDAITTVENDTIWYLSLKKDQTYSIFITNPYTNKAKYTILPENVNPNVSPSPTAEATASQPPTVTTVPSPAAATPSPATTDGPSAKKSTTKPAKGKLSSVQNKKGRKVKIQIKRTSGAAGYQIQYAMNKKFTKKTTRSTQKTSYTIKNLKSKKTYYIRVRAYVLDGSKKVYGSWSSVKKVKIKK